MENKLFIITIILISLTLNQVTIISGKPVEPNLIYVLEPHFSLEPGAKWLIVKKVFEDDKWLTVIVAYVRGELVARDGVKFYRPLYYKSIVLHVEKGTWKTYYKGTFIGRFPFYGLKPAKNEVLAHAVIKIDANRYEYHKWRVVGVVLHLSINASQARKPASNNISQIYWDIIQLTRVETLELYTLNVTLEGVDYYCLWLIEGSTGIPLMLHFLGNGPDAEKVSSKTVNVILHLLGMNVNPFCLQLKHVFYGMLPIRLTFNPFKKAQLEPFTKVKSLTLISSR